MTVLHWTQNLCTGSLTIRPSFIWDKMTPFSTKGDVPECWITTTLYFMQAGNKGYIYSYTPFIHNLEWEDKTNDFSQTLTLFDTASTNSYSSTNFYVNKRLYIQNIILFGCCFNIWSPVGFQISTFWYLYHMKVTWKLFYQLCSYFSMYHLTLFHTHLSTSITFKTVTI